MKLCFICKSEFKQKVVNQKMCSTTCVKKYRNEWMKNDFKIKMDNRPLIEKECAVCKNIFSLKRDLGRPKTCSLECSEKMSKDRVRNWQRKRKYNLTEPEYNQKLIEQNGCCAISNKSHLEVQNGLYVDHNHLTNEVRDLLCRDCNSGLGYFVENEELLIKASHYLKKHNQPKLKLISSKE